MLSKLLIKNYALIEHLELQPGAGLSIITGETGAGKSIILGALSLLTGGRADPKAVTDQSAKTVIEATFVDGDVETIVRREIAPSGRSRAFVDDSPVTLPLLAETTVALLDIHSQHAGLHLNTREGQLAIIDAFAGNRKLVDDYRNTFRAFIAARNRIKQLKEQNERTREVRDMLEYQLAELDALKPRRGEMEEIERRYDMLSDADELRHTLLEAQSIIDGEEAILDRLRDANAILSNIKMALVDPDAENENGIQGRLRCTYIELKDLAATIAGMASGVESNPVVLAKTGARLNALYEARKRYKVSDPDGLVDLHEQLRQRLAALDSSEEDLTALDKEARTLAARLKEAGSQLSAARRDAATRFSALLEERARPLGLPNLHFEVSILPAKLSADGADNVEFVCSFNKNGVLMPMSRTASGGELSRLTLCIKSVMAEKMHMPTVIFDEIDTGVSGIIADKMGRMMADMAKDTQIIAITHLPQVAARGDKHYKVFKEDRADRTVSHIRPLDHQERLREIAAMISGSTITDEALSAAAALIDK